MTLALWSYGVVLGRGNGATPETFGPIAQVRSLGGPEIKVGSADVTPVDVIGTWSEFILTTLDAGEFEAEVNYNPALPSHYLLLADIANRRIGNWRISLPNSGGAAWTFAAGIVGFKQAPARPDGLLTATIKFRINGRPTLAGSWSLYTLAILD